MDDTFVGHVEFYCLSFPGPADYLCIPEGLISALEAQAVAAALDRGEVVGQLATYRWECFLETVPVQSRPW
jgi:hypothetical protein